jgi:hypothetical protein
MSGQNEVITIGRHAAAERPRDEARAHHAC